MAFELKPMRYEDLDFIYSPGMADEVFKATREKKEWWPVDMHRKAWAIDAERGAYLFQLPKNREDSYWRYALGTPTGLVRLEKDGYCRYRVEYISPSLAACRDEVRVLVNEALRLSGELMNGANDPNDDTAIPFVELVNF